MKIMKLVSNVLIYAVLILVAIFVAFPLLYILMGSFKDNMEILTQPDRFFPKNFTFNNYLQAWNSENFHGARMLFNSIWYSVISVIITIFTSCVCGYTFARGQFRGKKVCFVIMSSLMFISLGNITIYPTFEVLSLFGLTTSLWGLLVMQLFGIPVVNIYLVRGFVNALPKEMDEAAEVDGCSFIGIFFRIIFPLLKPIIASISILAFNSSWNSYVMPRIFTATKPEQQTLIVGIMALKNSTSGATSWGLSLAGAVIAVIPVLVLFIFGNKYITNGIAAGAVKG